jgi:beta-galactosidase
MKNLTLILLLSLIQFGCINKRDTEPGVSGVKDPVITLNGTWKITLDPPVDFWSNETTFADWHDILVPGECQMQGFPLKHDQPFVYKTSFYIPKDYEGKEIFIDFYGVYSYARVWVNGQYVRDHHGGFTRWDCNITDLVNPGEEAMLTVEVTDRIDDISYASGYAKHQIGGILRDVKLKALPQQHFQNLWYETELINNYQDAILHIFYEMSVNSPSGLKLELLDSQNRLVLQNEFEINSSKGKFAIPVTNPDLWNAEHPNLYKAIFTLTEQGKPSMKKTMNIGFREVVIEGNKLMVNGEQVKLRGANRHDIHPTLGRTTTPELDKLDVLLAKEANMNFIRTSHYPPSEAFLDYCDRFGIYVENETAVCFVGSHRMREYQASGASQDDPLFTDRYLSQLEELVRHQRNHPSVIIWSIGNENVFGENFVKSYNWIKEADQTRPVIFSYPGLVSDSVKLYDILSMHYPNWRGDLTQYGKVTKGFSYEEMPVLFDEWAHVACYNNDEIKTDPNVRSFWGQSLDSMWTYIFEADGGLGGAIWCFIDETFMLPADLPGFNEWWGIIDENIIPSTYVGPTVGYGEWGIIDTWRRKKPEFWQTKKAYSPTKIYQNRITEFVPGKELIVLVHNRFDHTNFSELRIEWEYGRQSGKIRNLNLEPHTRGELIIPAQPWSETENLNISFYQYDTLLVDSYVIQLGTKDINLPEPVRGTLSVTETEDNIRFSGDNILYNFSKKTGLLENVQVNGETVIHSGPFINLKIPGVRFMTASKIIDYAVNWEFTGFNYTIEEGIAKIDVTGKYDSIKAAFSISFDGIGNLNVDYRILDAPEGSLIQEAGIIFIASDKFTKLTWNRDSYFTGLPANIMGSSMGEADLTFKPVFEYREKPNFDWEMDRQNFYYHGLDTVLRFTNIVRSMKENIWHYTLEIEDRAGIEIVSNGNQAARFDHVDGEYRLFVNDFWDYPSLSWGNYTKRITTPHEFGGKVHLRLE